MCALGIATGYPWRMETGVLAERLRSVLAGGPPVRLALLFGSAARGALRPDSDVDIAVVFTEPDLTLSEELALQARLAKVAGREVDLVRLDRASSMLRWRVAKEGVVLLADPPVEAVRFRARAAIDHADMLPQLEHAQERIRQRLAAGRDSTSEPKA